MKGSKSDVIDHRGCDIAFDIVKCQQIASRKGHRRTMSKMSKVVTRWNYLARKRGLAGNLSSLDWKRTLEYFHHRCAYCGGECTTMDHFIPQALHGMTGRGNCLPCCWFCNQRKGACRPENCSWIKPSALANIHAYFDPLAQEKQPRGQ